MELWDVYEINRNKTNKTMVRGEPFEKNNYHLVVHVCVFNSNGEMLIQQRQPFKKGWSNMWDITVGGSAIKGDTSQSAAERELYEEIGLTIDLKNIRPQNIGYPKALNLLKNRGTLALFWNKPFVNRENDLLHQKIQSIYQKYRSSSDKLIENDTARYNKISKTIRSYGFRDIQVKLYHQTRVFNSSSYISLLNTYSDHRSMAAHTKQLLYNEIENAILEHGDVINVYDTIDLYLARK